MPTSEGFTEAIMSDLRAFSPMLLEAGLTEVAAGPGLRSGPLGVLLAHVSSYTSLVPRLLLDIEDQQSRAGVEVMPVLVPRRATVSRRACDYVKRGETVLPTAFVAPRVVTERDPRTLSWLLHLGYVLEDKVERATGRLHKHVRGELEGRRDYTWALRKENDTLRELQVALEEANARLHRAQRRILLEGQFRLQPSAYPPRSHPDSEAFRAIRQLAWELEQPATSLPRDLSGGMANDQAIASLPFLYQRWCGVKIVQALRVMGWHSLVDPLPPLFLSGRIRFTKDRSGDLPPGEMTLWCEPHLTLQGRHPSGLYSLNKEASPDFVFITPGPHGPDAFVLDPTLSSDRAVRREKSRYLTDLAFDALQLVAGVPALHQPKRAWSAAPIRATRCELLDLEGRSGTVPMHPGEFSDEALRGWLGDVESYALGWTGQAARGL